MSPIFSTFSAVAARAYGLLRLRSSGKAIKDIVMSTTTGSYTAGYPFSSGFGTKYAAPATTTLTNGYGGITFNPTSTVVAQSSGATPYVNAWAWANGSGFGTKYANPATLPATVSMWASAKFDKTGNYLAISGFLSGSISQIYNWSSGFGTTISAPITGTAAPTSVTFSSSAIAYGSASSPYISSYAWSSGFGAKYADPVALPSSEVDGLSFNLSGTAIAAGSISSPYVHLYPFSSGFGTKYADPATNPANWVQGAIFKTNVIAFSVASVGIAAYPYSSGFGTKYANPIGLPGADGHAIDMDDNETTVAISVSNSPYVYVYPWSNGFGTKYADPATSIGGESRGVAFG